MEEVFGQQMKRIANRYGHVPQFADAIKQSEYFVGDLLEVWEDLNKVYPRLAGIVDGSVSDDELPNSLIVIYTYAWHVIQHLQEVQKALD